MEQLLAMHQQPPPPPPQHRNDAVERFRKMNPQEFSGGDNPMKAEEWIKSLRQYLSIYTSMITKRVSWCYLHANHDARDWWESARARKIQDFLELKQNGMSVGEYVRRFEQGCRFVPFIAEDENLKKNRFLTGLNPRVPEYDKAIASATRIRKRFQGRYNKKGKHLNLNFFLWAIKTSLAKKLQPKRWSRSARSRRTQHHIPQGYYRVVNQDQCWVTNLCNKCGRFHTRECPPDLRTCYIRHKQGHIASNRPLSTETRTGRVPARVY
ncbi:hypothetical protein OIU85_008587 [Salix viminalis]|uniref:Retrotransposon gag domain-containing protein n=1 Tax=Salix viminalis TaxID=40686 RepID=A0A9Q0SHV0_SALVM|nr:hypothetical protein OIU85_008587 [Salix viminalis]